MEENILVKVQKKLCDDDDDDDDNKLDDDDDDNMYQPSVAPTYEYDEFGCFIGHGSQALVDDNILVILQRKMCAMMMTMMARKM